MGRHLPFVVPSFAPGSDNGTTMDETGHPEEDHGAAPRLRRFRAERTADNPASWRVLEKCGFRYTGSDGQWCEARRHSVICLPTLLDANGAIRR